MAKSRSTEAKLSRLKAMAQEAPTQENLAELRGALGDKSNLVAAAAAEIVGERSLAEFAPDLIAAFDRFLEEPEETDKQCRAKSAVIAALNKIGHLHPEVLLRAIRYVQLEPAWGGSEDTAATLRGNAAFGLVHIGHPDVLLMLADLLADSQKIARIAAAQALGATRSPAAIPLLRFKVRAGDDELDVIAECFTALLEADPKHSISFVAGFLDAPVEPIAEAAALALGESRQPDALEVLQSRCASDSRGPMQEVLLLAISMTRLPAALEFLLEVLAGQDGRAASAALSALAVHRHNEPLKERVAAIVAKKNTAELAERFTRKFNSKV
jgi:HEAT repeat protein